MILTPEILIKSFCSLQWKIEDFNVVGIRSSLQVSDSFNDLIGCLYKVPKLPNSNILEIQKHLNIFLLNNIELKEDGLNGKETNQSITLYQSLIDTHQVFFAQGTTVPGVYWLKKPENKMGCAVLEHDKQFKDLWKIGFHKGKLNHEALVQCNSCEVIRDANLNNIAGDSTTKDFGLFGINCHRANINGKTLRVSQWSAGCQVFNEADNLNRLLNLSKYFNKSGQFTYSLLSEKSL